MVSGTLVRLDRENVAGKGNLGRAEEADEIINQFQLKCAYVFPFNLCNYVNKRPVSMLKSTICAYKTWEMC